MAESSSLAGDILLESSRRVGTNYPCGTHFLLRDVLFVALCLWQTHCASIGGVFLELSRFHAPAIASDHRTAPVNSLGYLRVMFTVEDIDDTLALLGKLGATVVDEVVNYEDIYRLCYIRVPEGILIGLAQQLGQPESGC